MLKEASLSELRSKGIPRERRVLVNRGRGNDELAPSDGLFGDFMSRKREREHEFGVGSAEAHNAALVDCDYEQRFRAQIDADAAALARIAEVAELGTCEDAYVVCDRGAIEGLSSPDPPADCSRDTRGMLSAWAESSPGSTEQSRRLY